MNARRAHTWAGQPIWDRPTRLCTCGQRHLLPVLRSDRRDGPTVHRERSKPRRALEVAA
ncbi:hypothetical protein [Desertihabitans brevis]|uniref:hypothetical protein n=1 Tax=Desertihabitans brevis TaxID=2268447 RepID=UPI001314A4BF|nr:hypothetical protein [Desertihabitans brevis]